MNEKRRLRRLRKWESRRDHMIDQLDKWSWHMNPSQVRRLEDQIEHANTVIATYRPAQEPEQP